MLPMRLRAASRWKEGLWIERQTKGCFFFCFFNLYTLLSIFHVWIEMICQKKIVKLWHCKKKWKKKKTWASLKDVCFVSEGLSPLSQVADICFEIFAFVAFCFFKPLYNHHPHRNSLCLQNCREWESLSRLNRSGRNSFQKYLNLCSALSARIKARHVCGSIKPAPACGPVNAAAAAGDVAAGAG